MFVRNFLILLTVACCPRARAAYVSLQRRAPQSVCYGELGCFHASGQLPVPQSPSAIGTMFELYRPGQYFNFPAMNFKSRIGAWISHFDSTKGTKVVIHGYLDDGHKAWIRKIIGELHKKGDFNIFVVNWGHGSKGNYLQAAANTFLVGAELTQLLTYLHQHNGLKYDMVHLIGHSLGAQTAGHAGRNIQTVARISGLDPADPYFSGEPIDRRLDASDAAFVDVIHTDASKFVLVGGYGTHDAVGHIDFFPNGGEHQPGCPEKLLQGVSLSDITGIADSLSCSHSRARDLFIESINSQCQFYGHRCPSSDQFESGKCLGCPSGGCPVMGYGADQSKTGVYFLSTSGTPPYCGHEYFVEVHVSQLTLHTYGEFIITLVGTHATGEPLKFESLMQSYNRGEVERHVISSHVNLGTVTSVKLQFVKATGLHGVLAQNSIRIHSVIVEPAENSIQQKFCAHEQSVHSGQTITISSHSRC